MSRPGIEAAAQTGGQTTPEIRRAMPGDLDWVAKLETETFGPDAWTPAQVAEELLGERRRGFVAVDRSGYAVTLLAGEVADLQRIAVRASLRRTGIGRDLLAHAQQQARGDGAQRMLLEVAASNATALGFYGRAGFAEIDRRPRYYKNGDDAVVMSVGLGLDGSTAS